MTVMLAATTGGGRATFLLEMALDRARLKERLAARLFAERAARGHGDARRFPQPEMARLIGYSIRQYQRLEDPDDQSLPSFADLERIAGVLEFDVADLFADDDRVEVTPSSDDEIAELRAEVAAALRQVEAERAEIREQLARIESLLTKRRSA